MTMTLFDLQKVLGERIEITNDMAREEMKSKLSVSWLKNNGIN